MIKYSLQNECLENIEAFTDEQYRSEMAVIESVLDVFDKACLMMELSNSDVNIPDCSMFMESAFFQEVETNNGGDGDPPTGNNQAQTGGDPATPKENTDQNNTQAANNDSQNKSGNGEKVTNNPEEYNKEHHFRKANKKGNLENIFISILLFIPRLLALPIKLLINFIKKKKDEKAVSTVKNATPEEKAAVANELKEKEGTEEDGVKIQNGQLVASSGSVWSTLTGDASGIRTNVDEDAILAAMSQTFSTIEQNMTPDKVESVTPILATFDFQTMEQKIAAANKRKAETQAIIDIETRERKRDLTLRSLNQQVTELKRCKSTIEAAINKIQNRANSTTNTEDQTILTKRIKARKSDLTTIKAAITTTNRWIREYETADVLTDKLIEKYAKCLDKNKQKVSNASDASENALNDADAGIREEVKHNGQ